MFAHIRSQFNRTFETMMATDASNQAIAGILSQYHMFNGTKQLHSITYHAKTFIATHCNWPIHYEELFAIGDSLRKWQDCLINISVNYYADY